MSSAYTNEQMIFTFHASRFTLSAFVLSFDMTEIVNVIA